MTNLSEPVDVRDRVPYSIEQFVIPEGSSEYIKSILISKGEICDRIEKLRQEVARDYKDKNLFVLGILQGAAKFMFTLFEDFPYVYNHQLIEIKSYVGAKPGPSISVGEINTVSLRGKDVLIVEDIIDTGRTLDKLLKKLGTIPCSVEICALLDKPERREAELDVKYRGFVIPNEFVVGFGLDYNENFRYFPHIAVLKEEVYTKDLKKY